MDLGQARIILVKPLTYMNRSGQILPHLLRRYSMAPERLVVVCDNMDMSPGDMRLKRGHSTGGHNGIASVARVLKEPFLRLYIGVGRPVESSVHEHVLGEPDFPDYEAIQGACERAATCIQDLGRGDVESVMNEYNRRKRGT